MKLARRQTRLRKPESDLVPCKLSNYKQFSATETIKGRVEINSRWHMEFTTNVSLASVRCCLCFTSGTDEGQTSIVNVDFLFELIDIKSPENTKIRRIPFPAFSNARAEWGFSIKKDVIDRFYDEKRDVVHLCVYIQERPLILHSEFNFVFD